MKNRKEGSIVGLIRLSLLISEFKSPSLYSSIIELKLFHPGAERYAAIVPLGM